MDANRSWLHDGTVCVRAALLGVVLLGCSTATGTTTAAPDPEPTEPKPIAPPAEKPCADVVLDEAIVELVEGEAKTVSGTEVVADGFMMRWIKRKDGISEHLAAARIDAKGVDGQSIWVGGQVPIGSDRYCVVGIAYPRSPSPGSVSLQKIVP